MSHALLALNWEPEIRGVTVVLIALVGMVGTSYLVLSTNIGARLGLLTILTALFGWFTLMGVVWWGYGIGLKGHDPTWVGKHIYHGTEELATNPLTADLSKKWTRLPDDSPKRGQAAASSDDIVLNQSKLFTSTADYTTTAVYDQGGARWPRLGPYRPNIGFVKKFDLDILAFGHTPHWSLVEITPNLPQNTEPGAAPPRPAADPSKKPIFVLMERDLGTRRRPAAFISFGAGTIFLSLVYMLHSRDKRAMAARSTSVALVSA
jgi:hypothetical protein